MKKQLFLSLFCLFSFLSSNNQEKIQQKFEEIHALGLTVKRYQTQKWHKKETKFIENIAKEWNLSKDEIADFNQKIELIKKNQLLRKGNNPTFSFSPEIPEAFKQKILEIGKSKKLPLTNVEIIRDSNIWAGVNYPVAKYNLRGASYDFKNTNFVLLINPDTLRKLSENFTNYNLAHEIQGHLKNWDTLKSRLLEAITLQKSHNRVPALHVIDFEFSESVQSFVKFYEMRADLNSALNSINQAKLIEKIAKEFPIEKRSDKYLQPQAFHRKAQKIRMMLELERERQFKMPNGKPNAVGLEIWYDTMWRKAMNKNHQG